MITVDGYLHKEAGGGYSVIGGIAGLGTQGDTVQECEEMLREAAELLIGHYISEKEEIPWSTRSAYRHLPKITVEVEI